MWFVIKVGHIAVGTSTHLGEQGVANMLSLVFTPNRAMTAANRELVLRMPSPLNIPLLCSLRISCMSVFSLSLRTFMYATYSFTNMSGPMQQDISKRFLVLTVNSTYSWRLCTSLEQPRREISSSQQSEQDGHSDTKRSGDEDQDARSESTAETPSMQAWKLEKFRARMVRLLILFDDWRLPSSKSPLSLTDEFPYLSSPPSHEKTTEAPVVFSGILVHIEILIHVNLSLIVHPRHAVIAGWTIRAIGFMETFAWAVIGPVTSIYMGKDMANNYMVVCLSNQVRHRLCSAWVDPESGRGCDGTGETTVQSTKRMIHSYVVWRDPWKWGFQLYEKRSSVEGI